jgi:acylphosphatase
MKKAVKLTISGTVQGIFFRNFCKDNADKLALKGYVRNLESGEVEVLIEGDKEKIEEMYKILKQGPPHSQIRDLKPEEKKWTGEFSDFKILRF